MNKNENESIINPELYHLVRKYKIKIYKDFKFQVRKKPTCREFFRLLLRRLRNKFLGFCN